MSAISERLTPLDSTFLELEQADEGAMMHIGGALIFGPQIDSGAAPSLEQLIGLLDERFTSLPRFRCRLSESRVHGLRRPAWVADPNFDLRTHVRHATLPAPGGDAELHEWLADFWSHRLDRGRRRVHAGGDVVIGAVAQARDQQRDQEDAAAGDARDLARDQQALNAQFRDVQHDRGGIYRDRNDNRRDHWYRGY